MSLAFTPKGRVIRDGDKYVFTFFCDLCDCGYTTETINADGRKRAVEQAGEEARRHFNLCHRCQKWVCDVHYNEDVMYCIACAPKNNKNLEGLQ